MGKKSIVKSASVVSLITIISLLISFLKESVFAYWFGTSFQADAYNIATQLPITLFSLISCAIGTTLIPSYTKLLYREGSERAQQYVQKFTTLIICISSFLIILGEMFPSQVIRFFAPGLQKEAYNLAVTIFRIVLPTILFTELSEINTGILNSHKNFVVPAMRAIFQNTAFIVIICFISNQFGIFLAVVGLVIGILCEWTVCARTKSKYVQFRLLYPLHDSDVNDSIKKSIPVFLGIGAAEINKLVDRVLASFMASGTVTMLSYASKLSGAISSLFISALSTVLFPEFSVYVAKKEKGKLSEVYQTAVHAIMILLIPISFGVFFVGRDAVSIVYYRGQITINDVKQITPLFVCYTICLVFTAFRQVNTRILYAYGNTRSAMINSTIGFGINIILNIILSSMWGAIGLAIATVITNAIIGQLLFHVVLKDYVDIEIHSFYKTVGKCLIAGGVMSIVLFFVQMIPISTQYAIIDNLICFILHVLVGALIYFVMLWMLKVDEIHNAVLLIKSKIISVNWRK